MTSTDHLQPKPDPDHAWKVLSLINEWIRHSDAKAGVTLALTGVLATLTFNLTKDIDTWSCLVVIATAVACLLLVVTVGLCAWTLTPRTANKTAGAGADSLLYFADISKNYARDRRDYRSDLTALVADPARLAEQLADQVHANALIATVKTKSAAWAIRTAVASGTVVAVLALIINMTGT